MKLIGRHAEDVGGGRVVEPGSDIPDDVDAEVLEQLQADGKVYDDSAAEPSPEPKTEESP